ncbi:MAG TPA: SGNH hydrolase domain-containing protein [Actinoplanes sp.]
MSRSRKLVVMLAMLTGLVAGCTASETPGPHPSAEPAPRLPLTKVLAAVRRAPAIRTLPSGLTPPLTPPLTAPLTGAGSDLGFDSDKCEAGPSATRIDACVFGDPAGSTRVVLLGDSHASMWLPALSEIAQRRHWQLTFYGKPACPASDITFWNQRLGRAFTECDQFRSFAVGRIRATRPALVLVADSSYLQKAGPGQTVTATEWQGGLTRTLARLRRSGARVIVIGDAPVLARSGPECLAVHARNIVTCLTTRAMATERVWNAADEAAARATGSGYVSVLPWLCGAVCTPVVGNVLVYRNQFDLTATYSRMLNGVLESALVRSFPQENAP